LFSFSFRPWRWSRRFPPRERSWLICTRWPPSAALARTCVSAAASRRPSSTNSARLARPDVELVTEPIERIVPDGVVTADGTTRVANVIIYGTGFKAAEFLAPMLVSGLGGWRLQQAWPDGPRSYLGITVSGSPNFFMLYGPK
jgi:cation diffusion facilitator CzcD-associated flavoprotein CzcO